MTITCIKKTKNLTRYHIYVDDKFFGVFLDEIIAGYKLRTEQEIDENAMFSIKRENDERLAFIMAIEYVEKYSAPSKKVKEYLLKKNFDRESIANACEKLKEYGYVDDNIFAKNYAETLSQTHGKNAIRHKLKEKGVASEIIEEVLLGLDDENEYETALNLAKVFVKNREDNPKNKQKCIAHLVYKGYDYNVATEVTQKVFTKESEDDWS